MKDYSVTIRSTNGSACVVFITAACINDLIRAGWSLEQATEAVEQNAFSNAINRGEIKDDDCWIESYNR